MMANSKTSRSTTGPSRKAKGSSPSAVKYEHFLNRELSWLEFNRRVLEEAQDATTPLLDRVKFLSIFSSNLDEFFMVRVAGLREQAFHDGVSQDRVADGMSPIEQLRSIRTKTQELIDAQYKCLNEDVLPQLITYGIRFLEPKDIERNDELQEYYHQTVYPVISPMAIDPSHPRPRYHNRALYLAARLRRRRGLGPKQLFAVVQIPQILPRLVSCSGNDGSDFGFVLLEDLIEAKLPELFGGFDVETTATFRITRDSDIDMIEQESDDMLRTIEERLRLRQRADAVRLEVSAGADEALVEVIVTQEQIRTEANDAGGYSEVYPIQGPVDLSGLTQLLKLPSRAELCDPPFVPQPPRGLRRQGEDIFSAISRRDILMHHPFESFTPVVDFVQSAAADPDVLAIKQTLYRTSGDSPIVKALISAAENGKQVTAIVELKARFDEQANVSWARQMERSGVHVVYGFMDLKTHSKVSLVVRREGDNVRRYVHLSTGNYNPNTALTYTDMGLFTSNEDFAVDVSALFNLLTGYSQSHRWRKLTTAPKDLQSETIRLINEQTRLASKNRPSAIFAKLNSLVDPQVIEALYRASQTGVPIELIVRGICCLRPGVPGISDNIRVRSIVDRFLEHSRLFVFGAKESAKVFVSSADWMPRNFFRRVEVMFPVESPALRRRILTEILPAYLADNVKARELRSDGSFVRIQPSPGEDPFRCQTELLRISTDDTIPASKRERRTKATTKAKS